jgi:hypothetical protein
MYDPTLNVLIVFVALMASAGLALGYLTGCFSRGGKR